ncbi:MAG: MBL fold metallo-hydrolase [Desulfobacterales bacterium]|nr:MBL fold metallo-hydrolase [Desulfobacterales bacterium]
MAATRIRILCENRAGLPRFILGEHGFSAHIQHGDRTLLLDTGQGMTLAHNAGALKIDLSLLDHLVISHGHYDHTGGLAGLPPQRKTPLLHAHPGVFTPKYLTPVPGDAPIFIGSPVGLEEVKALNILPCLSRELSEIAPGIWFSGEIPRVTDFERPDPGMTLKTKVGHVPDLLLDDTALLISTDSGPIIVTGCAHAGIVNTMEHFSRELGFKSFHSIIGGTHLAFTRQPAQLEETMAAFNRFQVRKIAVSHCTGEAASAALYHKFGNRFAFAHAGWQVRF